MAKCSISAIVIVIIVGRDEMVQLAQNGLCIVIVFHLVTMIMMIIAVNINSNILYH